MRYRRLAYRTALLAVLGLTGVFSRMNANLPTKWHTFIETLQVSTGVVHSRLRVVDEEVGKEYIELERDLEKQLGLTSLYSLDDIKEIKEEVEKEVELKT